MFIPLSLIKTSLIFSFILSFCCLLNAQKTEEFFKINSGQASYEEEQLILSGKVKVEHEMGSIAACHLIVHSKKKNFKKGFLEVRENIELNLKNGAKICCQRAEIDCDQQIASCFGNQEKPLVTYFLPHFISLEAEKLSLDIKNHFLDLVHPKGSLKNFSPFSLTFTAQQIKANQQKQFFHFIGNVSINEEEAFQLVTFYEVYLKQLIKEDKTKSIILYSPQETTLIYKNHEMSQKINCPGPLNLESEPSQGGRLTLFKSETSSDQVHLEGKWGKIYADLVTIDYQWKNQLLTFKKISIKGKIKLTTSLDLQSKEPSSLCYILADGLDYHVERKEIVLTALGGKKVLLYDKKNNIQMSAPSLKIHQDKKLQKQVIQGIGDVRFTFIQQELKDLKNLFEKEFFLEQEKK